MRIEFITNASAIFHFANGKRLLTDPWYSDGIYLGTLFNFPPLTRSQRSQYLGSAPDYIYISHFHGDHLDPASLSHFSKDTPVLIGEFATPALKGAVRSCGFTDIRELPFRQVVTIDGFKVVIFPQFAPSGDDAGGDDYLPVDTSILVEDVDGASAFFAVDNPMQVQDAVEMRERFGEVDAALLPYSGASVYPWAYRMYSPEEKSHRAIAVRQTRLTKFCDLAAALGARHIVPAAGTFIYGGRLAEQAQYQLHATPKEIVDYCDMRGMSASLRMMATGDVLDVKSGHIQPNPDAPLRNFSDSDRMKYAATLAGFACPLDSIAFPAEPKLPWRALLRRARNNLWQQQQESALHLSWDVELVIRSAPNVTLPEDGLHVRIPLDRNELMPGPGTESDRSHIRFYLDGALLIAILTGAVFWNIAEYFMELERNPDIHNVRIHQLMAYFRL
jgi:L-ascorbate metabolism protein UlaG (beta-lactamase superfamily)